ncbi:MAG TPA: SufE family protein [Beijerinckiaceae bacterium]|nr:SufE family protein [Beijerinckiaceae bacterium]
MSTDLDSIIDDLAFLDDWEERYRYIIDLGRTLAALNADERSEQNKVRGCASQVWLVSEVQPSPEGPRLRFRGDSDAHIVKGLVALTLALFSGRTAQDILATDAQALFARIGLKEHLTPQRSNGLAAMVERIRADARHTIGHEK